MAQRVLRHLKLYGRPTFPARPAALPEDREMYELMRGGGPRSKRTTAEEKQCSRYGAWRAAVYLAESRAARNLLLLLSAVRTFEASDAPDCVHLLREYAHHEFGVELEAPVPQPPASQSHADELWASAATITLDLVPMYMRTMEGAPWL